MLRFFIVLLASCLCWSPSGQAETGSAEGGRFLANRDYQPVSRGFWEKNGARNVFSTPPAEKEAPAMEYFVPVRALPEDVPEPSAEENAASRLMGAAEEDNARTQENLTPREKLLKEFGDPAEEAPVQAVESAPKPFKGMMAALEAGDEKLAFDYARQYVRYTHRVQERSMRVVGMTGLAMEREGLVEDGKYSKRPGYSREMELLEASRKEAEAQSDSAGIPASVDSEALALLDKHRKPAKNSTQEPEATKQLRETTGQESEFSLTAPSQAQMRAKIRAELAGKVPVDPQGRLGIYFFFKPNETASVKKGAHLQNMAEFYSEDRSVEVLGVMMNSISPADENVFRLKASVAFPIVATDKLAKLFNVTRTPTVVIVARTTGKSFTVSPEAADLYLEEAIRLMKQERRAR